MIHPRLLLLVSLCGLLSCAPEPSGVVDDLGVPPLLRSVVPSAITVNTDTMNVGPDRLPTDLLELRIPVSALVEIPAGARPLAAVEAWVTNVEGVLVGPVTRLLDEGTAGDSIAGDSRFGGAAIFSITRVEVGVWTVRVAATSANGARSITATLPLTVFRNNRPPVLSNLTADTSVSLSSPDLLLISIRAVDADGTQDIKKVYFNSFLPSGNPSSGNPFLLLDDGNTTGLSGDLAAGDRVYSLRIQFAGAAPGAYRFEFHAVDRSSDSSNVVLHQIQVRP
ncbi:MAG: hypothetical protein AABY75_07995 [Bacteroidota bacterium]